MKLQLNRNMARMAEAIRDEWICARVEDRAPRSSNAITRFRLRLHPELSVDALNELFELVFDTFVVGEYKPWGR